MTNEELVAEIRNGKKEYCLQLWEQVERFITIKARDYFATLYANRGITVEDLQQAGYLALMDAVRTYSADRGANFISFLSYWLHNRFSEAAGLRTDRTAADPLNNSVSLDAPIGEDQDGTLSDIQADPRDNVAEAETRVYLQQLRADLEKALDSLGPNEADAIRQRFFQGKTLKEAAEERGVSLDLIRQREAKGLRMLRRSARRNGLDAYVESRTPYYKKTSFHISHTSPVEELAMLRERLRLEYERRQKVQERGGSVWRRHRQAYRDPEQYRGA